MVFKLKIPSKIKNSKIWNYPIEIGSQASLMQKISLIGSAQVQKVSFDEGDEDEGGEFEIYVNLNNSGITQWIALWFSGIIKAS